MKRLLIAAAILVVFTTMSFAGVHWHVTVNNNTGVKLKVKQINKDCWYEKELSPGTVINTGSSSFRIDEKNSGACINKGKVYVIGIYNEPETMLLGVVGFSNEKGKLQNNVPSIVTTDPNIVYTIHHGNHKWSFFSTCNPLSGHFTSQTANIFDVSDGVRVVITINKPQL